MNKNKSPKVAAIGHECVACGTCIKVCPMRAIHIHYGMYAIVSKEKCIGCGKCSKICVADVITIVERKTADEKEMV